ncbi:hypothetical protein FRC11_004252 [Ceratobasidium sp. 423]|nr:hypothetical protein FRC11_004252 [Ceratobasidium sp. 423]
MSLKPTVALHGALPVLQPEYFSSDLFVVPLRLDLESLLTEFARRLRNHSDHCGLAEPAASNATDQNGIFKDNSLNTFKSCWESSDWKFMHLRCLDAIGRTTFLRIVHRTFLEYLQTFVAISTTGQDTTPRGPGRVTVTNRLRTARRAVDELQAFLDGDSSHTDPRDSRSLPSFTDYTSLRALMTGAAGPEIIDNAVRETSQNLRNAEDILVREGMTVEVDPELRNGQLLGLVHDTTA